MPRRDVQALALALAGLAGGCAEAPPDSPIPEAAEAPFAPEYLGVSARPIDADIALVEVRMRGARDGYDVDAYARCAAAGYGLKWGFGYARHLRTKVDMVAGMWVADAVYTFSPTRPEGRALDAGAVVAACDALGIPTV